jgi:hypothetical protein
MYNLDIIFLLLALNLVLICWPLQQFFLKSGDVGKNRAEVTVSRLAELNPYVKCGVHKGPLTPESITKYQVPVTSECLCSFPALCCVAALFFCSDVRVNHRVMYEM